MSPSNAEWVTRATSTDSDPSPASADVPRESGFRIIAEAVLDEHTELDKTVRRLRGLCESLRGNQAPVEPSPASLIEEFESLLIPHFAAEEADEFFGSLVTDRPSLLGQVERLQAEHLKMAETLEELLELARGGSPEAELGGRLARFLDWFDAHEHAENALMQAFMLLDEGGGG